VALKLTAEGFLADLRALKAGAHVALAVSGGGDSMGMLALAAAAKNLKQAPDFSVLTVDHGLRPEAAREAEIVAEACDKLGLPHVVLTADIKLTDRDIQQQARDLRYRLMGAWCAAHGAALALAHHRDDQAETVMMRLARGSGIDGLAAMRARQIMQLPTGPLLLVRPFLKHASTGLHGRADKAGLPIIADPSNLDRRFERVRWRQLMPELAAQGLDAGRLAAFAETMRATSETLNKRLHGWLQAYAVWHDYGVLCLPRRDFLRLPVDMQNRLLSLHIRHFGGHHHPKKRRQIDRLRAAIGASDTGGATLGGVFAHWRRETVFLGREAAACLPLPTPPRHDAVWDRRFVVTCGDGVPSGKIAALAAAGVQSLRDRGQVFDDGVPAAYLAALPGLWQGNIMLECPALDGPNGVLAYNICELGFARDTLGIA
jgi:tRNA(Ile)-lysidine synthase